MFLIKAKQLLGKYYSQTIPDMELTGVYHDTRKMKPGGVFVCLCGEHEDGHRYALRAQQLGAKAVIASKNIMLNIPVVLTDNTHAALAYLTLRFYGRPNLKLIGITGTNGKTTVSYFCEAIFKAAGHRCGIIGTNGAYMENKPLVSESLTPTTPNMPELYAMLKELEAGGADMAVMEVTSHALVQKRVEGLEFETGIFTNLTQDHLDYHKSMEAYFAAKKQLFGMCKKGAVNTDDEYGRRIFAEHPDFVQYGINGQTVHAANIEYRSDGADFDLILGENTHRQKIHIPGEFSVYNALAAACCAYTLGIDDEAIVSGLEAVGGVCGRMERLKCDVPFGIIIDYAHTPDGLMKVLEAVRKITAGRVICVFGCGGDRDRTKRGVMGAIATRLADIAVITSDNPRTEPPTEIIIDILTGVSSDNYIVIENREKAIGAALGMARAGDTVLLAGKGQERYQIIGKEKRHFDEREIVFASLGEMANRA